MATILIVDDLAANRKFLVTLLRHHGHTLLEAADGSEGLTAVAAGHPDLVITDVLMPVMDGYEFVRQLRLNPATRETPVVFYTAHYGEREARALALSSGVAYVLTKPAGSEAVLRIVSHALSGESETPGDQGAAPTRPEFGREHLRLLTDKLSEKAGDLRNANARLRALINIGLELASERDSGRLIQSVCVAAHDLFGATYVTLGILNHDDRSVNRVYTSGAEGTCETGDSLWISPGDPVPGWLGKVVAERRTLRGHNPGGDPAALNLPALHPEVRAFLAAPIASPAHVYGWICLVGNEGRTFTEDDEHLVLALAGQVGRIYELEYEILERHHAEKDLRRERDRAQRYLDTAEVILVALDVEGRVTLINRKGCEVLGWSEPELLGRNWMETCLPPHAREGIQSVFGALLRDGQSVVENPVLTKAGQERLIGWRNTVLRDDDGRVIGTFSSGADITEKKQSAEALRAAEERMRFALEAAGVGIYDMDYVTGVIKWSEILEAQYGMLPGTFAGTFDAFIERVHPADRQTVLAALARAKASGGDFAVESRAMLPDGTFRWLSRTGRIQLNERGEPLRGVGISLDVTERHTLEEQYQQAQKMDAIGRLAGGVAHDFNNLLAVILGHCELLLDDLAPLDPRRADISEIQRAGERAAGLTRQLLAFSRKQLIEPTLLDVNVIVSGMQAMLKRLIEENVKVVIAIEPAPALVHADRGQMEQVVLNLAVNARDAMPSGGTLTIDVACVELDENYARTHLAVVPGPYVALTVSDTGSGMTPQVLARLFEPFFTTKESGKGTGLGLATVHGIATRSGGTVNVHSEIGRGTSFKVYFPRAEPGELATEPPPSAAEPRCGSQTVLLVEDAEELRELARRLLERHGYTVLLASNATEAHQIFDRHDSIDVILTDVVMPGASGPEMTRRLVERRPALKVIYMSGYTEEAIAQHGVINPGIAFLHKPFTSEALARKIREVLTR